MGSSRRGAGGDLGSGTQGAQGNAVAALEELLDLSLFVTET